jgi:DNA polymerase V
MGALDDTNGRFGQFTAVPAAQGFKREWKMRFESRSPAWITRLGEMPMVRVE